MSDEATPTLAIRVVLPDGEQLVIVPADLTPMQCSELRVQSRWTSVELEYYVTREAGMFIGAEEIAGLVFLGRLCGDGDPSTYAEVCDEISALEGKAVVEFLTVEELAAEGDSPEA